VAVIDELERQNRMQNGLDARSGRIGVRHRGALLQDHVLVGHGGQLGHFEQCGHAHGSEAFTLDGGEIPAAALNVANVHQITEVILFSDFDGGVATAMEHECWISAKQAGGVDALSEGISSKSGGFSVVPEALHNKKGRHRSVVQGCLQDRFTTAASWLALDPTRPAADEAAVCWVWR